MQAIDFSVKSKQFVGWVMGDRGRYVVIDDFQNTGDMTGSYFLQH